MRILGIIASSILKSIADAFNRTTSGSLGTADTGQTWVATRGTWYANGTKAQSDDAGSNNSIASLDIGKTDVVVTASVSKGTGPVFWLSDSGSWWASVSYSNQTISQVISDCGYCGACSSNCTGPSTSGLSSPQSCSCGQPTSQSTTTTSSANYYAIYGANASYACAVDGGTYTYPNCTFSTITYTYGCSATPYTPPAGNYPTCNCNTPQCTSQVTTTNYFLKLLKSVSGTVSEATSAVSLGSAAAAIAVTTVGDAITAKAYSDTGLTTQLGSTLSYTATSPTKGTSVGILKTTSAYSQESTVDNFTAN